MKKPKILRKCEHCGKDVWKYQSQIDGYKMSFCSRECQHAWRTGKKDTTKKKGEYKTCQICSKEFYCYPYEVKTKKACSPSCSYKLQSIEGIRSGENCNFWTGGFDQYRGPNWNPQKAAARKRDKNICKICGKTKKEEGKQLTVHHIVPFRFFNNDYNIANKLENLITICSECHGKMESHGWLEVPDEYKHLLDGVVPQEQIVMVRKYSDWEIEYIKTHYEQLGPQPIAEFLKRPRSSVVDKACQLGIKKKFLTQEEEELLIKHYPTSTREELQKLFPSKKYNSIKSYANRLGLVKLIPNQAC